MYVCGVDASAIGVRATDAHAAALLDAWQAMSGGRRIRCELNVSGELFEKCGVTR